MNKYQIVYAPGDLTRGVRFAEVFAYNTLQAMITVKESVSLILGILPLDIKIIQVKLIKKN
jgi:hypothetical protein